MFVKVIVGARDILSPPSEAKQLAEMARWRYVQIEGAAHAVPVEQALRWRKAVLSFLDDD